jgi:uncharacterized alkaline shock family protein YloU
VTQSHVSPTPADLPAYGDSSATPNSDQRFAIRVAPEVVALIVRRAAESVPGVARLAESGHHMRLWRRGWAYAKNGIRLAVEDGRARIPMHVVIERDHSLQVVGGAVRDTVVEAIETLVGMPVATVDIYIQDVDWPSPLRW